jgi:hypothetical protein
MILVGMRLSGSVCVVIHTILLIHQHPYRSHRSVFPRCQTHRVVCPGVLLRFRMSIAGVIDTDVFLLELLCQMSLSRS